MTSAETKKRNVEYFSASNGKRFFSFLIDFFLVLSVAGLFAFLCNLVVNSFPAYAKQVQYRENYQKNSGFYTDDFQLITYDLENSDKNILERAEILDEKLDRYYTIILKNNEVLEGYLSRKDSSILFKYNAETKKYEYNTTNYSAIYEFFKSELYDRTLGFFMTDEAYHHATQIIFAFILVDIFVGLLISSSIFLLLLPLTFFKRGRQTLGQKLNKIALINGDALNVKDGKFVGRFFFIFFIEIILGIATVFIPVFVSVGMALISKNRQNLHNYVFGTYLVDVSNQVVYLNYEDYIDHKTVAEKAKLENKEFEIK